MSRGDASSSRSHPTRQASAARFELIEPPRLTGFGLPDPDTLVAIAMRFQIAQKLHAVSDPHGPPGHINDRARDVVDLLLLRDLAEATGSPTRAEIRAAAIAVFQTRADEAEHLGLSSRSWATDRDRLLTLDRRLRPGRQLSGPYAVPRRGSRGRQQLDTSDSGRQIDHRLGHRLRKQHRARQHALDGRSVRSPSRVGGLHLKADTGRVVRGKTHLRWIVRFTCPPQVRESLHDRLVGGIAYRRRVKGRHSVSNCRRFAVASLGDEQPSQVASHEETRVEVHSF